MGSLLCSREVFLGLLWFRYTELEGGEVRRGRGSGRLAHEGSTSRDMHLHLEKRERIPTIALFFSLTEKRLYEGYTEDAKFLCVNATRGQRQTGVHVYAEHVVGNACQCVKFLWCRLECFMFCLLISNFLKEHDPAVTPVPQRRQRQRQRCNEVSPRSRA